MAIIRFYGRHAGMLIQNDQGFHFQYSNTYLTQPHSEPISKTLPLQKTPFTSATLFSFFDGLIPEGWLRRLAEKELHLQKQDRMELLLACCKDAIGAVSVHETDQPFT